MKSTSLRWARKQLKFTQQELADAIGMARNSVARMERGELPIEKRTELAVKFLLLTKVEGEK